VSTTRDSTRLIAKFGALLASLAAPCVGCTAAPGITPVTSPPSSTTTVTNDALPPPRAGAHRPSPIGCQPESPPLLRSSTTFQRFVRIVHEQLDVSEKDLCPESTFIDDLGADSLGLVELVLATEEEFEIDIPDEDTEKLRTVRDVVVYLDARQPPQPR
jgi:acyl carrier protein